jgi:hypothetical protein
MKFNFFEEYSTLENLEKAKLVDFKSTIFLTANSFNEYKENKRLLTSINSNISTAYWPILPNSYWISPFSYTKDLQNFIKEIFLINEPLTLLIDLELPLVKHKELYFKNFFSFWKNKKIIKKIFQEAQSHNINIVTAEYPPFFVGINFIYRLLGISFNVKKYKHTQCIMYYTSMISNKLLLKLIRNEITKARKLNPNLQLGLGTIATGVLGNEPILSIESLKSDIDFMKVNNIKTGIIFRLGGLNESYLKLLNNNI